MGLLGSGNISFSEKFVFKSVGELHFFSWQRKNFPSFLFPKQNRNETVSFSRTQLVPGLDCSFCRSFRIAVAVRPTALLQETWECWEPWASLDLGLSQNLPGCLCSPMGGWALAGLSVTKFLRQIAFECSSSGDWYLPYFQQIHLRDASERAGKMQNCWCPHTMLWSLMGEAELGRLHSHAGGQASQEKTWPDYLRSGENSSRPVCVCAYLCVSKSWFADEILFFWEMMDQFLKAVSSGVLILKYWCIRCQWYFLYQEMENPWANSWVAIHLKKNK